MVLQVMCICGHSRDMFHQHGPGHYVSCGHIKCDCKRFIEDKTKPVYNIREIEVTEKEERISG